MDERGRRDRLGSSLETKVVSWEGDRQKMLEGNGNFFDKVVFSFWRDCLMDASRCGGDGLGDRVLRGFFFGVIQEEDLLFLLAVRWSEEEN